nr:PhzF family phenazine biosynthesis protein [Salipiger mucosus]
MRPGAPTTGFVWQTAPDLIDIRFHSTRGEMDMCGHVTIAAVAALRDTGRVSVGTYRQRGLAGTIGVTLAADGLISMTQPVPDTETCAISIDEVATLIGLSQCRILELNVARASLRHLFVEAESVAALGAIKRDDKALFAFCAAHRIDTLGLWAFMGSGTGSANLQLRDLCHGVGDPEEAASGTTNAALAGLLHKSGRIDPDGNGRVVVTAEQGVEMGRPSRVTTELVCRGGAISELRVGGQVRKLLTGTYFLSGI